MTSLTFVFDIVALVIWCHRRRHFRRKRGEFNPRVMRARTGDASFLQCLQVFDQLVTLAIGQQAAYDSRFMLTRSLERMAEIAVARDRRSVTVGRREPGFAVLALLHFA